jgi:hypothetical protein
LRESAGLRGVDPDWLMHSLGHHLRPAPRLASADQATHHPYAHAHARDRASHGWLAAPATRRWWAPLLIALVLLAAGPACQENRGASRVSPAPEVARPGNGDPARNQDGGANGLPGNGDAAASGTGNRDASGEGKGAPAADPPPCHEAVCCIGPQCPKRPAGTPCQTAEQCETGFCADGVCCNVACQGACVACNQADRMGECLPTAAGAPDPHLICRHDAAETCGQSGVCNGEGGCAKHNAGVPCGAARCDGDKAMLPASECDGEGACVPAAPIACAPYLCDGQSCRVTCTDDSQCVPPRICGNGSCGKRGGGQTCGAADQCESGFCVDGVCCESACTGRCTTCASAKARGKCLPVPAGNADLRALAPNPDPAAVCADQGPQKCGANGRCDGKGGCESYRDNTICAPGSCDPKANASTPPNVCRVGRCERPAPQSCAPFAGCAANRCSTNCAKDQDCAPGNVCTDGSCGKRPIGSVCSRGDECAGPGVCAQGRCCASACDRPCMACNLAGQLGSCQPVPAGGADPIGSCRNDACSNGCDGSGHCRREREGTSCGPAACTPGGSLTLRSCSADGTCAMVTAACPAGQICRDDRCAAAAKQSPGEPCMADGDCASGACVAGRCCAGACNGECRTCTAQSEWRCIDRTDDSACAGKQICRSGRCVPPCTGGRTFCGADCVDLRDDPVNCGGCGQRCDSRLCEKGVCLPGPSEPALCPPKQVRCAAACVDLGNSVRHCGACDHPCGPPLPLCVQGKCAAAPAPGKPDAGN